MIATEPVLVSRDGAIATLTLNWPERRNALSVAMRHRLADAFEDLEADRTVRAVVLTGTGEHFCAGGDLTGMHVESVAEGRERMRHAHRLIRLMVHARFPIVAAVEGWCAGAGISLACASDHVVAGAEAKFLASFGKVGLLPDLGLLHTLPARVGQARDLGHRHHGAEDVRDVGDRDQPGALGEHPLERLEVDLAAAVDRRRAHARPGLGADELPGDDVAVVLELGNQDLVAFVHGLEQAFERGSAFTRKHDADRSRRPPPVRGHPRGP